MAPKPRFYQPTVTRFPSLACLFASCIVIIALTELACRWLPGKNSSGVIAAAEAGVAAVATARLHNRNDVASKTMSEASVPVESWNSPITPVDTTVTSFESLQASAFPSLNTCQTSLSYSQSDCLPVVTPDTSNNSSGTIGVIPDLNDTSVESTAPSSDYLPIALPTSSHAVITKHPNSAMASTTKSVASITSSPSSVADTRVEAISPHEYLIGAFIPTVLAVVFTIPWNILASAVKEIEPFYQMQRANGASAASSLTSDYKASISVVATMNAMSRGHFLVWGSGLLSLITLSLSPLASETVFIGFDGHCTATSGRQACSPHLSVYPLAARVIQGILTFIAIITLALAIDMWHKRSGIYADPWSIAGLATLFQNRRLIEMFRQLDPSITKPKALKAALKSHRYQIAPYEEVDGESGHGIMICQSGILSEDSDVRTSFRNGGKYAAVHTNIVNDHTFPARPKPRRTIATILTQTGVVVIFAFLMMGLEALVIVYYKTGGNTAFERFMDSDAFGVRFLFTAVGVMVKLYWNLLDDETRKQEPYRQLLHGNAQASDSILLSPHSNPFTGLFHSLKNLHYFNVYTSFVAILCEPLIVALANIPFKPGLAFIAYRACTYITIAVLSLMLIGIAWMLCREKTPTFRRPETLADMMIALCGSRMLADFKGLSDLDRRERDAVVEGWGKRYAMGSVVGVDGVERDGIDEQDFDKIS